MSGGLECSDFEMPMNLASEYQEADGDVDLGLRGGPWLGSMGSCYPWGGWEVGSHRDGGFPPSPEAPWPSSIFSLFSLGWRQEKELGRKRRPPPRAKARVENIRHGFHTGEHHISAEFILLNRTQSPSITESFP